MKWSLCESEASEKLTQFLTRFFGGRGIYYLLMIATIGLLLAADFKWSP
jgi:hypothetical protein